MDEITRKCKLLSTLFRYLRKDLTMKRQCVHLLIGILVFLSAATAAEAAKTETWRSTLQDSLISSYEPSKISIDSMRISKPGILLVIRKDNISGDLVSDFSLASNKVIDGKVQQANTGSTSHVFKPGETLYINKIFVTDTEVQFMVVSGDTYEVNVHGTTLQTRYKTVIRFQFQKGTLETTDAATVKKIIEDVIAPQSTVNEAKTATVELGQTPEQVEAALGKPETIVKLGPKVTYVYKAIKVVFQDGKVSDVQ
jgi:hypothetical protein